MNEWFKNNSWALIIAVVSIGGSYVVNNYRIAQLEKVDVEMAEINQRQWDRINEIESQNGQMLVTLERIKTDIEYIKSQLNKIVP